MVAGTKQADLYILETVNWHFATISRVYRECSKKQEKKSSEQQFSEQVDFVDARD